MARPTDEFLLAWESLAGEATQDGWRSIPVAPAGSCQLMAARRFPGNGESLLAHFPSVKIPVAEKLPEGPPTLQMLDSIFAMVHRVILALCFVQQCLKRRIGKGWHCPTLPDVDAKTPYGHR